MAAEPLAESGRRISSLYEDKILGLAEHVLRELGIGSPIFSLVEEKQIDGQKAANTDCKAWRADSVCQPSILVS